jgi:3-oxoadipate enol-lactonase
MLLHGWGASADLNWGVGYRKLSKYYSLLAPDHRGHGQGIRSPEPFSIADCADDAAEALRTLDAGPAVVAGYSMGGPIALEMARRHPELVSGLVLCATAARFGPLWAERFGLGVLGALGRALHRAEWLFGHPWLPNGPDLTVVIEAAGAIESFDARPWLAGIAAPAVVVATTHDHLVPPTSQFALARALDAPVVELGADHDAPFRNGSAFVTALLDAAALVTPVPAMQVA